MAAVSESTTTRYLVGYAMAPKKVNDVFRDSLIELAAEQGIDLVPIDLDKPLMEQHHFDCVVHKIYGEEWRKQLVEFSVKHPDAVIIDQLDDIYKLHSRITMLEVVNDEDLSLPYQISQSFGIPKQIFVQGMETLVSGRVGLKFPMIAKSLLANGTPESHKMFLIFNEDGLSEIEMKPPFVLQEFVNHGGVIFKVYVAGDHVRCVKRRSLPDISEDELANRLENSLPFSQISNVIDHDQCDDGVAKVIEEAEMPPSSFVTAMAYALRRGLNLNLFNFDLIRESSDENSYFVIDINYFPGYAKMPFYETMLIDFFLDIFQHRQTTELSRLDIKLIPETGHRIDSRDWFQWLLKQLGWGGGGRGFAADLSHDHPID